MVLLVLKLVQISLVKMFSPLYCTTCCTPIGDISLWSESSAVFQIEVNEVQKILLQSMIKVRVCMHVHCAECVIPHRWVFTCGERLVCILYMCVLECVRSKAWSFYTSRTPRVLICYNETLWSCFDELYLETI